MFIWAIFQRRMTWFSWIGLACALVAGIVQIQLAGASLSERTSPLTGHAFSTLPAILFWLSGLTFICLSMRYNVQVNRLPTGWLNSIKILGSMTYPLYLLHFAIGIQILDWLTYFGAPSYFALGLATATVCGLALAVCRWGEPSIRKILRPLLDALGERMSSYRGLWGGRRTV